MNYYFSKKYLSDMLFFFIPLSLEAMIVILNKFWILTIDHILFFVLLIILWGFLYIILNKLDLVNNFKKLLLFIIFFVGIEQAIKIFLNNMFKGSDMLLLVKNVLYLSIKKNIFNSYYLSIFKIQIPVYVLIILKFTILLLLYFGFKYYLQKYNNKWCNIAFVFCISASLCSLIDTIAWGYSLDYFLIKSINYSDGKDIYLSIGLASFFTGLNQIQKNNNKK